MSGTFREQIRRFTAKTQDATQQTFVAAAAMAQGSIQNGSPLTGSPGQPVGQYGPGYHPGKVGGTLKASWMLTFPDPMLATISTTVPWAVQNEYGISATDGPYRQRSTVGGRHSVALTVAGWQTLVTAAAATEFQAVLDTAPNQPGGA